MTAGVATGEAGTDDGDPGTMTDDGADTGRLAGLLEDLDPYRVVLYAILLVMVAFYLAPLETGLVSAFKTRTGVGATLPFLPSLEYFTLDKWATAFDALGRGLLNSALYAIPATVISAFLGSIAAYGITQANWRPGYKAFILALFVAGIFIPYQAVLIPLSRFWSIVDLGSLLGPLWSVGIDSDYAGTIQLIVTHVAYGIPICTVLFRAYYKNMSVEMIESARLDGATLRRVYRRIVFPLSTPMFAVVLIYQFTQIWNDLLFALILISTTSSEAAPAVLILAGLGVSKEGRDFALQMAGAFITALPTIVVYIMFSEEFSEGVAA